MKQIGLVSGLLLAAFCSVGSFLVPQAASANPIGTGASVTVDFVLPSGNDTALALGVGSLDGTLSVEFIGGPNLTFNGPNPIAQTLGFSSIGGTLYATVSYSGSSNYETSGLLLTGNNTAFGSFSVPDSIVVTPIPASLPLFLTGAGLLYGFARRRGSKRAFEQFAT